MSIAPRDPYSEVVDERRRWNPEWYSFLVEIAGELYRVSTVGGLPPAAQAGTGARAFVTDATATTFLSVVAGGGTNRVPVVSNGTNWLIG